MSGTVLLLFTPYKCAEGFVIGADSYWKRKLADGTDQVFTTFGWATPIEASTEEPTAWPGVFTTGTMA